MIDAPRLNLGCGLHAPPGWVNIDRSPNVVLDRLPILKQALRRVGVLRDEHMVAWPPNVVQLDLVRRLPYGDNSVDAIYSSHTFEHLYHTDALALMRECHRVLRPGGVLRLALPDAERMARDLADAPAGTGAAAAIEFSKKLNMAPLSRPSRKQLMLRRLSSPPHRWQPTTALVVHMLQSSGFSDPTSQQFLQGALPDLSSVEHRENSLFVEAAA